MTVTDVGNDKTNDREQDDMGERKRGDVVGRRCGGIARREEIVRADCGCLFMPRMHGVHTGEPWEDRLTCLL